jgi:hypothetical protein
MRALYRSELGLVSSSFRKISRLGDGATKHSPIMNQSVSEANYKESAAILRGLFRSQAHAQSAAVVVRHAAHRLAGQHAAGYDKR